jgi:hypothetical protein
MVFTSLPRKPATQKVDPGLKFFDAIGQPVSGIAATTNPSSEFARDVVVVEMGPLRWPQTAITQPVRRTRQALTLGGWRGVTKPLSVRNASAVLLSRKFPFAFGPVARSSDFFLILLSVCNPFRGFVKPVGSRAAIKRRLLWGLRRLAVKLSDVGCAQASPMLICERLALPSFTGAFQ